MMTQKRIFLQSISERYFGTSTSNNGTPPYCDVPVSHEGPVYFSINREYERLLGISPNDLRMRMEPFGWHAFWNVASLDDAKTLSQAMMRYCHYLCTHCVACSHRLTDSLACC
jgi:hypothetical protein